MWQLASHRRLHLMSMLKHMQRIVESGVLNEEKRGERAKGRQKRRLKIQDGRHMPSRARQTFSWQSISLTSHISDAESLVSPKACVLAALPGLPTGEA